MKCRRTMATTPLPLNHNNHGPAARRKADRIPEPAINRTVILAAIIAVDVAAVTAAVTEVATIAIPSLIVETTATSSSTSWIKPRASARKIRKPEMEMQLLLMDTTNN